MDEETGVTSNIAYLAVEIGTSSRPSQAAALLSFLHENLGERIVWDDMYRALGSHEVNRTIATLRKRGIIVLCDLEAKASSKGKVGLYRLSESVEVRTRPIEPQ